MKIGIVGLPNAGKSTLFNALTKGEAQIGAYAFTTIDQNIGVARVPDNRLNELVSLVKPKKITPTTVNFVDIAGLVKGASKGEGLGNKFLSHIREVDAIAHIVRCFPDSQTQIKPNPKDDIETINLELMLADLEMINRRTEKIVKLARSGDKDAKAELAVLEKAQGALEKDIPVRLAKISPEEEKLIAGVNLLTDKPVIYVANVEETEVKNEKNPHFLEVEQIATDQNAQAIIISASIEAEIAELDEEEKFAFFKDLGINESGLSKLIHTSYKLLDLLTFYTAGVQEVRAWTVQKNAKAPEAAGKIHTDIQRGFIKAEVVYWQDFIANGGWQGSKEKGHFRIEGKDYLVKDGDVIYFRFNV